MNITTRTCQHCGCSMPCKTARKAYCTSYCRTNHYNQQTLIRTVRDIAMTITSPFTVFKPNKETNHHGRYQNGYNDKSQI